VEQGGALEGGGGFAILEASAMELATTDLEHATLLKLS